MSYPRHAVSAPVVGSVIIRLTKSQVPPRRCYNAQAIVVIVRCPFL